MIIQRKFQFDAAHMLSQYVGKCANLHGHTYTGEVRLEGCMGEDGMLVDYNRLKEVVDCYDHCLLFSEKKYRGEEEEALFEWAEKFGMKKKIIYEGKCTAENIAKDIAKTLRLLPNVKGVRLWLHETPDSTAIASL